MTKLSYLKEQGIVDEVITEVADANRDRGKSVSKLICRTRLRFSNYVCSCTTAWSGRREDISST